MARDAVSITAAPTETGTATPAGTTITPANGANIAGVGNANRLLVRVTNTDVAAHNVTFRAGSDGTQPPALRGGLGDLVVSVGASGDSLFTLESARHVKSDGSIDVDFATGFAGKISAVLLPKGT